jgi:peptidoglycan L-alanyl-D-glutamate endopeptidase CwlK
MPQFSSKSSTALNTAETDLIIIFNEVIRYFDCSVIYGNRSQMEQWELYKKGRAYNNNTLQWEIVDQSRVVTYKDGTINLSNHNYSPSRAVDVTPYPINWKDVNRLYLFAGYVLGVASRLKQEGHILHNIRWGGDWDRDTLVLDETFLDLVHFEIII